jgi:hypothetical protein
VYKSVDAPNNAGRNNMREWRTLKLISKLGAGKSDQLRHNFFFGSTEPGESESV